MTLTRTRLASSRAPSRNSSCPSAWEWYSRASSSSWKPMKPALVSPLERVRKANAKRADAISWLNSAEGAEQENRNSRPSCSLLRASLCFALCLALMGAPLRVFEYGVRDKFCSMRAAAPAAAYADARVAHYLGENNGTAAADGLLVLPGQLDQMPWCNESLSAANLLLPAYYAHIQQKYWDVGLFAYWRWRKAPLFALAAPTLALALFGVFRQTVGLLATDLRPVPDLLADRRSLLPFALQALFLALSGLFFYNVEVSIRLLFSASPFLYMVLAKLICAQTPHIQRPEELMHSPLLPFLTVYACEGFRNMLLLVYLLAFFIFGTMAHVNWFPYV